MKFKLKQTPVWIISTCIVAAATLTLLFQNCAPNVAQSSSEQTTPEAAVGISFSSMTENSISDSGSLEQLNETLNECSYSWYAGPYSMRTIGGFDGIPTCSEASVGQVHYYREVISSGVRNGALVCHAPAVNCNPKAPPSFHQPILVKFFSSDWKTPAKVVSTGHILTGAVYGLDNGGAASCMDIVGETDNCNDSTKYISMPNSTWQSAGTLWMLTGAAAKSFDQYAGKTLRHYVMNKVTGARSAPYEFSVVTGAKVKPPIVCGWQGKNFVAGPCAGHTRACNQSAVGQTESVSCGNTVSVSVCECK